MIDVDCAMCQDTGRIGMCWCSTTYPPCSGCTEPLRPDDEWRICIDCDDEKENRFKDECDCPDLFSFGCQDKENHR